MRLRVDRVKPVVVGPEVHDAVDHRRRRTDERTGAKPPALGPLGGIDRDQVLVERAHVDDAARERGRRFDRSAGFETPVVGCGGINSFSVAESALRHGECDLVAAARQSLADPDWFLKMELGRGEEIRRCIYTNYCEGLDQKHVEVTCQLWDRDFSDEGNGEVRRSKDGKRRLEPPGWSHEDAP